MDQKIESQVNEYLSDETKLYQDWYTGLFQEGEQYATQVGVIPDFAEIKRLFEKWFNKQRSALKGLCGDYCQKKQEKLQEPLLIASVVDGLTVLVGIPFNIVAVATILVLGKFLDRLCDCPKGVV